MGGRNDTQAHAAVAAETEKWQPVTARGSTSRVNGSDKTHGSDRRTVRVAVAGEEAEGERVRAQCPTRELDSWMALFLMTKQDQALMMAAAAVVGLTQAQAQGDCGVVVSAQPFRR